MVSGTRASAETGPPTVSVAAVLLLALLVSNAFWLFRGPDARPEMTDPLIGSYTDDGSCLVQYWEHNAKPAFRMCDDRRDGVYEETTTYNREGEAVFEALDHNQNGVTEQAHQLGADGEVVSRYFDDDEDGFFERYADHLPDGRRFEWFDRNGDRAYDERNVYDASGSLLLTEQDTPNGFQPRP